MKLCDQAKTFDEKTLTPNEENTLVNFLKIISKYKIGLILTIHKEDEMEVRYVNIDPSLSSVVVCEASEIHGTAFSNPILSKAFRSICREEKRTGQ